MNEFETNCVDLLEYHREGDTYAEWKHRTKIRTAMKYEKKFDEMVIYLLTRRVIDCKDGLFYYNSTYVKRYIVRYKRVPNFCIEHLRFFQEWINQAKAMERGNIDD